MTLDAECRVSKIALLSVVTPSVVVLSVVMPSVVVLNVVAPFFCGNVVAGLDVSLTFCHIAECWI